MNAQTNIQTVTDKNYEVVLKSDPILPADPMLSMIERIALDPNADLDKLERMLVMKERLDANRRQQEFSAALSACQAEIPIVLKNKNNKQTASKYADLASIYQAAKPVVAAHGLSFSTFPVPCEREGFQGIRWALRHEGGHIEEEVAELIPSGDDVSKSQQPPSGPPAVSASESEISQVSVDSGDFTDDNR